MQNVDYAFIDRHAAADSKNAERDNERPEVELASMSERMFCIRRFFTLADAERISNPLPVSTAEWMPSDNIAELPVKKAAVNFVAAIRRFPMIAAKIAVTDSAAPSRFIFFFAISNGAIL